MKNRLTLGFLPILFSGIGFLFNLKNGINISMYILMMSHLIMFPDLIKSFTITNK